MTSPFALSAPLLWANNYSAIPIWPRTKKPHFHAGGDWAGIYCNRLATPEEQETWLQYTDAGVGVALGPASGIFALDFDNDVDGMQARIISMIPDSPVKKTGAKGFSAFYKYTGEQSKGLSIGGVRVLDILSTGRQTILPASFHPDTGLPYKWLTEATLENTLSDDLPTISVEVMQEILALFKPKPITPAWQRPKAIQSDTISTDDLWLALSHIPADDYDIWLQIGMALKLEMGQRGYNLWDKWSSTSSKYNGAIMNGKWGSFNRSDITIGTVYHLAKTYGYIPVPSAEERPRAEFIFPTDKVAPPVTDLDILNAPGLIGRTMKYILDTSIYPIPILALGASIAAVGAAMSHKVQTPTRLRTNFYTLGLAPSGAGKGHAMKAVSTIFSRANMREYIAGEPASGAGLLTGLQANQGKAIILWDEIGRIMLSMMGKNAGSYQRDIISNIIKLFSASDTIWEGVQYANHDGKQSRKTIDQPSLSIYGATVPKRFYDALTSDDSVDGFLPRFLVFEAFDYDTLPRDNIEDISQPPDDLISEYEMWKGAPSNSDPAGNIDGATRISPRIVPYAPEAKRMIDDYDQKMRDMSKVTKDGIAATYARAGEHAKKLALAGHTGDEISAEVMTWGIKTAEYCTQAMLKAINNNVSSSDFERLQKRILRAVSECGGDYISHTELVRKTQELPSKTRNEVLGNLVEGGAIELIMEQAGGSGKPTKKYRSFAA